MVPAGLVTAGLVTVPAGQVPAALEELAVMFTTFTG